MVKKKKRSFMSKLFSRRILLLIQFIVSIIFLGCIYILKMLPMKYYLILCGIIFLLWMLSSLLIKSGIKKKKRENKYARLIFGKLLSLILSIALGFVSVMAFKGNNFLSNITGSFTQTRVICMYVKKESAIKNSRYKIALSFSFVNTLLFILSCLYFFHKSRFVHEILRLFRLYYSIFHV